MAKVINRVKAKSSQQHRKDYRYGNRSGWIYSLVDCPLEEYEKVYVAIYQWGRRIVLGGTRLNVPVRMSVLCEKCIMGHLASRNEENLEDILFNKASDSKGR